jgi:hypothetical protein
LALKEFKMAENKKLLILDNPEIKNPYPPTGMMSSSFSVGLRQGYDQCLDDVLAHAHEVDEKKLKKEIADLVSIAHTGYKLDWLRKYQDVNIGDDVKVKRVLEITGKIFSQFLSEKMERKVEFYNTNNPEDGNI